MLCYKEWVVDTKKQKLQQKWQNSLATISTDLKRLPNYRHLYNYLHRLYLLLFCLFLFSLIFCIWRTSSNYAWRFLKHTSAKRRNWTVWQNRSPAERGEKASNGDKLNRLFPEAANIFQETSTENGCQKWNSYKKTAAELERSAALKELMFLRGGENAQFCKKL